MISTELLSKAVYERMHAEQQAFRKELLAMKPEDILDQAYVYAVREDILCAMENTELSMRQAYALLATETPLAQVYKTYLGKDTDYMEHIYDSLEDFSWTVAVDSIGKFACVRELIARCTRIAWDRERKQKDSLRG